MNALFIPLSKPNTQLAIENVNRGYSAKGFVIDISIYKTELIHEDDSVNS